MDINKRFAQIIKAKGVTKRYVSEQFGVKEQYIINLTNGNKSIGLAPLKKIKELWSDVNVNWLLFGQGDMFLSSYDLHKNFVSEPEENYGTDNALKNIIALLERELSFKNKEIDRLLKIVEENNYK